GLVAGAHDIALRVHHHHEPLAGDGHDIHVAVPVDVPDGDGQPGETAGIGAGLVERPDLLSGLAVEHPEDTFETGAHGGAGALAACPDPRGRIGVVAGHEHDVG